MASSTIPKINKIITLTPTYDTSKISRATARLSGNIIQGEITIKAGVLNPGYNGIDFNPGKDFEYEGLITAKSQAISDDEKIVSGNILNHTLGIRINKTNVSDLKVCFIGIAK